MIPCRRRRLAVVVAAPARHFAARPRHTKNHNNDHHSNNTTNNNNNRNNDNIDTLGVWLQFHQLQFQESPSCCLRSRLSEGELHCVLGQIQVVCLIIVAAPARHFAADPRRVA